MALLGEAYARSGRLEDAARLLDQALALCRERRERGYEAWTLRIFGEIALLREPLNAEHAASAFIEARALAEDLKMRPLQAHCHLGLGTVCRRTGDPVEAEHHLTTA
jgi:tetratricopeptide (TPR) repeat protein